MHSKSLIFRLTAALAASALALTPIAPSIAQPAPPPGVVEPGPEVTPAMRVGRIARTHGEVSFHAADQTAWSPAIVNYPLITGDAVWTETGAEAEIQISDTSLTLDGRTEVRIDNLGETNVVATVPQGEVYLRLRHLRPDESYTLTTPRGTVRIAAPGRYAVVAGTEARPTLFTVLDGEAELTDPEVRRIGPGQTAVIGGAETFYVQLVPAIPDPFINAMLARERAVPTQPVAPPPLVAEMPGGADLAAYGDWSYAPDYGAIWYPSVAVGWVPYRYGHWAYIPPWGWTWIDDAPWGFAPFHYGRWVLIGGRWGWLPGSFVVAGAPAYPVYAPALVAFFSVGVTAALLSGSVGWVPLGPYEPYYPWFRASPAYARYVNIRHYGPERYRHEFREQEMHIDRFHNARGATMVPAAAMVTSRPVRQAARPADPRALATTRPILGRPPVPPTSATLGVTPGMARRMGLPAPPPGVSAPARRPAPGPAIQPRPPGGPPSGRARPELVRPAPQPARPEMPRAVPGGAPMPRVIQPSSPRAPQPPSGREAAPPRPGPGRAPAPQATQPFSPRPPQPTRREAPPPRVIQPPSPRPSESAPRPEAAPPRPGRAPAPQVIRPSVPRAPQPTVREPPRPAPQPAAPMPRVTPTPRAAPPPAYHPAPVPRAAPAPRPAPPPAYHPAPAPRPAPPPSYRPSPAPHPATRAAPPPPHREPQQRHDRRPGE